MAKKDDKEREMKNLMDAIHPDPESRRIAFEQGVHLMRPCHYCRDYGWFAPEILERHILEDHKYISYCLAFAHTMRAWWSHIVPTREGSDNG